MSLTAEKLLKPRYEVLAEFPGSEYAVGAIIDKFYNAACTEIKTGDTVSRIADFPHLFRKMSWWECRPMEHMPKFVQLVEPKGFFMVQEWMYGPAAGIRPGYSMYHCAIDHNIHFNAIECLPISEAEYLAVKNNEKSK